MNCDNNQPKGEPQQTFNPGTGSFSRAPPLPPELIKVSVQLADKDMRALTQAATIQHLQARLHAANLQIEEKDTILASRVVDFRSSSEESGMVHEIRQEVKDQKGEHEKLQICMNNILEKMEKLVEAANFNKQSQGESSGKLGNLIEVALSAEMHAMVNYKELSGYKPILRKMLDEVVTTKGKFEDHKRYMERMFEEQREYFNEQLLKLRSELRPPAQPETDAPPLPSTTPNPLPSTTPNPLPSTSPKRKRVRTSSDSSSVVILDQDDTDDTPQNKKQLPLRPCVLRFANSAHVKKDDNDTSSGDGNDDEVQEIIISPREKPARAKRDSSKETDQSNNPNGQDDDDDTSMLTTVQNDPQMTFSLPNVITERKKTLRSFVTLPASQ